MLKVRMNRLRRELTTATRRWGRMHSEMAAWCRSAGRGDLMATEVLQSLKLDIDWSAQTILPIEFHGKEVVLEARAYQGQEETAQAMALINRGKGAEAA